MNGSRINVLLALKSRALKMCLSNMPLWSNITAHVFTLMVNNGYNLTVRITENQLVDSCASDFHLILLIILCLFMVS